MRRLTAGVLALCLMGACTGSGEPPTSPSSAPSTASEPSAPTSASVEPSKPPPEGVVVVAVGDIVCHPTTPGFDGSDPDACQDRATAALVRDADAVLALGDLQYERGSLASFRAAYDRSWGRLADITFPTPGNHEYGTLRAAGYFDYWAARGRPTGDRESASYSFDLGAWHVISLNSNCEPTCGAGSPQDTFLERDLAGTASACVLAFWHHPLFNSGTVHGEEMLSNVRSLWDDLFAAGADLVVNGHEHNYQRYGEQSPSGLRTPRGIREFVVGTGGRSLYGLLDHEDPNLEAGVSRFGILRLFLRDTSYSWEFVGVGGAVLDRGGPTNCV